MCFAAAAIGSAVSSGLVTAYGQYLEGKQAKTEANYRSDVAAANALRAEYAAQDALDRGEEEERRERQRQQQLQGQIRAVLASSGQVVDEGSAGDLLADQAVSGELAALDVRTGAERQAHALRERAQQYTSASQFYSVSGENAQSLSRVAVAATLLGTGGKVASRWYQFSKVGAPS